MAAMKAPPVEDDAATMVSEVPSASSYAPSASVAPSYADDGTYAPSYADGASYAAPSQSAMSAMPVPSAAGETSVAEGEYYEPAAYTAPEVCTPLKLPLARTAGWRAA